MVFHKDNSYSTTLTAALRTHAFLHDLHIDPYIRKFVSPSGHSHHEYFVDPRPIDCTNHLWLAFLTFINTPLLCLQVGSGHFWTNKLHSFMFLIFVRAILSRLHRASDTPAFAYAHQSEYQGRRFRALPPHSTFRIISSPDKRFRSFISA